MSSQTIVELELTEYPSQPTTEGTLDTHSIIPTPHLPHHTTRPGSPESDPDLIINTPHSSEPEQPNVEQAHLEEQEPIEDLDIHTLDGSGGHTPATVAETTQSEPFPESFQISKKGKQSKRKETKKDKKKKPVDDTFDLEPPEEPIADAIPQDTEESSFPPPEEVKEKGKKAKKEKKKKKGFEDTFDPEPAEEPIVEPLQQEEEEPTLPPPEEIVKEKGKLSKKDKKKKKVFEDTFDPEPTEEPIVEPLQQEEEEPTLPPLEEVVKEKGKPSKKDKKKKKVFEATFDLEPLQEPVEEPLQQFEEEPTLPPPEEIREKSNPSKKDKKKKKVVEDTFDFEPPQESIEAAPQEPVEAAPQESVEEPLQQVEEELSLPPPEEIKEKSKPSKKDKKKKKVVEDTFDFKPPQESVEKVPRESAEEPLQQVEEEASLPPPKEIKEKAKSSKKDKKKKKIIEDIVDFEPPQESIAEPVQELVEEPLQEEKEEVPFLPIEEIKGKGKKSKKEKKKKKGAEDLFDSPPAEEPTEEPSQVEKEGSSILHSEEVKEEPSHAQIPEVNSAEEETQERNLEDHLPAEELLPQHEPDPIVQAPEEFPQPPEIAIDIDSTSSADHQDTPPILTPEPDENIINEIIEIPFEPPVEKLVKEPVEEQEVEPTPPEPTEDQDQQPVQVFAEEETSTTIEEPSREPLPIPENQDPQPEIASSFEPSQLEPQTLSLDHEESLTGDQIQAVTHTPEIPDPSLSAAENEPIATPDTTEISPAQEGSLPIEDIDRESTSEILIETPVPVAEEIIISVKQPVYEEIISEPEIEEQLCNTALEQEITTEQIQNHISPPEIEPVIVVPEIESTQQIEDPFNRTPSPDAIQTEPFESHIKLESTLPIVDLTPQIEDSLKRSPSPDTTHTEPEYSYQNISSNNLELEIPVPNPTPPPRPFSSYASTVEDSPEESETQPEIRTPPQSIHSYSRTTNTRPEVVNHIPKMTAVVQDRSLIASQLSDALALFNSFDESVKSLVTRLQSNENTLMTKPEHDAGNTPQQPSAPFKVPYSRNPNFHGRFALLSQIFGMWRPQQRCRIGVSGLGGLGKTELLVEFVYRARLVSPNTPVFWFGPDDIRSKETATTAKAGMQLEDWLRTHHERGALLVVDSGDRSDLYETATDRGSFINDLRNFDGTVILVSRNGRDGNLIARPHEMCEVRELELDACVNIMCDHLETYAHDATTEREIQEVVKSLYCIPRAVIQVTKVINSTQMTVSQFYSMFSTGEAFQLRLFSRIDHYSKPDHDMSVIGRGVFDLRSFRKSKPGPSRLLYQIYYLGGKAVPFSLVETEDPLDKILLMIIVRAQFAIEEDFITETFSIHPMVYLTMRKALGSERPLSDESEMLEERKWYDQAVLAFSKHYPDANCEDRTWWKDTFTQLISGYNMHSDTLRIAIATIYHRESAYFKRKGIFSEALKMASLAKSVLPDPVPSECLVIVQDQVTMLDFLAKYREVHEMLRGLTMEVGHPGNLWKKSMMAKLEVADCANRYDTAIEIFKQVRTAGDASNADKLDLANATDDLSMALMQKGKYREAATECRKALAERSSRLGGSHTDTLSSCHNLAEILHKDGKFDESHRYIQEALRGRETALGPEHPETLYSKVLKARILISKATTIAEFDEAETVLNNAIERLGAKLSPNHPTVMTCKSEIARIMFARGKYEAAEAMNLTVLAAREQGPWLEPATHPDTMTSRNQLADVIRLKDGSKAADNLSERCLTERTVVLTNGSLTGEDFHPDQLASLHNRAVILSGLGQHLAALQKIDLALLGRKAILGERHPDYFISMTWKGEIMRAQLHRYQSERTQTLDTIENLHKQAYEGLSWMLGSEHQSSLQCATHMALAKRERGSPASSEAEGLFRQIHCAYQHNMGDFHPETLKSKGRLAEAMRAASPRHHIEAKKLWRDSCGGLTRIYGFDAHVTANAYKGYEKFLRTYPDP